MFSDAVTRVVPHLPRRVREIVDIWIPLSDGTRLTARIWLPEDAEEDPVPGVLEYIPYRKSDLTAARDVPHYTYVVGHGYACVRVALRGSATRTACSPTSTASRSWTTGSR